MSGLNMQQTIREIGLKRRTLTRKLGNNTLNLFQVRNFNAQGFIDDTVRKWKKVRSKKPGERILIRTGRLRRSGKVRVQRASRALVMFDVKYASYVNKERPIVGSSKTANRESRTIIERHYRKIFGR